MQLVLENSCQQDRGLSGRQLLVAGVRPSRALSTFSFWWRLAALEMVTALSAWIPE